MGEISNNRWPDYPALERRHGRPQPVWHWAEQRRWHWVLVCFRVPVLAFLLMVPLTAATTESKQFVQVAIVCLALLLFCTALAALAQRIYLGDFDRYRREIRLLPWRNPRQAPLDQPLLLATINNLFGHIYLTVVSFGVIYKAIDAVTVNAFELPDYHSTGMVASLFRYWYFSSVTLATVGYGDIHPMQWYSQLMVTLQILLGPIVLSLLVLAWSQPRGET